MLWLAEKFFVTVYRIIQTLPFQGRQPLPWHTSIFPLSKSKANQSAFSDLGCGPAAPSNQYQRHRGCPFAVRMQSGAELAPSHLG